jgi:hypothetical protein
VKILARASAGVDKKWVVKINNAPVLCENLQVWDCRENFGQGFRRGRRKMGSKNQ